MLMHASYNSLTWIFTCSFYVLLQLSNMEVWFQRPKDIVRKLLSGDLDLGIVGLDTVTEYGQVSIKV